MGGSARTAPRPGARHRQHPRATSGTHGRVLWGAPPRKGCDSTNVGKAVGLRVRIRRRHSRCLSARERLAGGSEAGAGRPVAVTKRVGQPQQGETGHPRWGRGQGGTSAFRAPERGPERGHDPELGAACVRASEEDGEHHAPAASRVSEHVGSWATHAGGVGGTRQSGTPVLAAGVAWVPRGGQSRAGRAAPGSPRKCTQT